MVNKYSDGNGNTFLSIKITHLLIATVTILVSLVVTVYTVNADIRNDITNEISTSVMSHDKNIIAHSDLLKEYGNKMEKQELKLDEIIRKLNELDKKMK